ncbi:unnamed protein product [Closterium sp. NIES-54]
MCAVPLTLFSSPSPCAPGKLNHGLSVVDTGYFLVVDDIMDSWLDSPSLPPSLLKTVKNLVFPAFLMGQGSSLHHPPGLLSPPPARALLSITRQGSSLHHPPGLFSPSPARALLSITRQGSSLHHPPGLFSPSPARALLSITPSSQPSMHPHPPTPSSLPPIAAAGLLPGGRPHHG